MTQVSYTDLRQNLARYLDEAVEGRAPIVITRQAGKGNVVLLSEEEFAGWQETVHLLRSPANARRLLHAIESVNKGDTEQHELVRPDTPALPLNIHFTAEAWDDYRHWLEHDRAMLEKLNRLIDESCRTPFRGLGKPEPLKGDLSGWWSRRLSGEHRLVYRMQGNPGVSQRIEIAACRYHYGY